MEKRRRRGYKFTEKKHSRRGMLAAGLAAGLLVWYGIFVWLAYASAGTLSVYYGGAGGAALLFSIVVLVLAAGSLREEDVFPLYPRLALVLSMLALVCWLLTYVLGFVG